MSGTLENTFHGQKVFSLVMGSFSSSEMQYFHKGGPLRLRIVTKLPGSTKMLEEKNFLFQQRYLGNQMTQVGTKLKIFARTLMSAHLNNSLLAGVQEKREKLGADLAHPLGLREGCR